MDYSPGACNIGRNEIRKRYAIGALGFLLTAVLLFALSLLHFPRWAFLLTAVPLMFGFEGVYQGRFHFCAGFAYIGVYDLTGSGGKAGLVKDADEHRKDMGMAMRIHLYSALSAIAADAAIYLALYLLLS